MDGCKILHQLVDGSFLPLWFHDFPCLIGIPREKGHSDSNRAMSTQVLTAAADTFAGLFEVSTGSRAMDFTKKLMLMKCPWTILMRVDIHHGLYPQANPWSSHMFSIFLEGPTISPYFWVNYNDLTRPHHGWWLGFGESSLFMAWTIQVSEL